jgi:hypothetical protein
MEELMDAVSTLVNAIPLLAVTVIGGWLLNGRLTRLERKVDALPTREEFGALEHRSDRFEQRVDAQFARVDSQFARVDAQFARVDSQFDTLRSDVTQIALAVGARTRPQTG